MAAMDEMSFWDHLEVLRRMLLRILAVSLGLGILLFIGKDWLFGVILAPGKDDFLTYRAIEKLSALLGGNFQFQPFRLELISTELSAQLMLHLKAAFLGGLLLALPWVLWELLRFVRPALYNRERRYAGGITAGMYLLFAAGTLVNYFILFPVACRFLGSYSVSTEVKNLITLNSYVDTFFTLSLLMGLLFQLPVITFVLGKLGWVDAPLLKKYRKVAFVLIMVLAALITPPDIFTLILVTLPIYLLYELSIGVLAHSTRNTSSSGSVRP